MVDSSGISTETALKRFIWINWLLVAAWMIGSLAFRARFEGRTDAVPANVVFAWLLFPVVYRFLLTYLKRWSYRAAVICVVLPILGFLNTVILPIITGDPFQAGRGVQAVVLVVTMLFPVPSFILFTARGFALLPETAGGALFALVWGAFCAKVLFGSGEIARELRSRRTRYLSQASSGP